MIMTMMKAINLIPIAVFLQTRKSPGLATRCLHSDSDSEAKTRVKGFVIDSERCCCGLLPWVLVLGIALFFLRNAEFM